MSFNWYGFIIGLSIVVAWQLIISKAKENKVNIKDLEKGLLMALIFGILGARAWHVATDFYLYQDNLLNIFKVWQGGLSILGAVVGGSLGLFISNKKKLLIYLDLIVFGLPIAQTIGRLGNFINQELYGLPSNLPWAIYIKPENRLVGFELIEKYHPLFAYEALLMLALGVWLWALGGGRWAIGSGKFFKSYIFYYLVIRFLLDFLRLDKEIIFLNMGINQIIISFIIIFSFILLINKKLKCEK